MALPLVLGPVAYGGIFLLVVALCVWLFRSVYNQRSLHLNFSRLDRLTRRKDKYTLCYAEDSPLTYLPVKTKLPHVVLMLTGLSASPEEFTLLCEPLKQNGIAYYVPKQCGWGLTDFHLLDSVKYQDWIRSAMLGYELLCHVADNVSIVAHSTGAPLAVYVASHCAPSHPIQHLVLSGPNIVHNSADATPRRVLLHPWLGNLMTWLSPRTIPKPWRPGRKGRTDTLHPTFHENGWYSSSFPVYAVREGWKIVSELQGFLSKVRCSRCWVMMGQEDMTVGKPTDIADLLREKLPKRTPIEVLTYPGAGHNWFKELPSVARQGYLDLVAILSNRFK